MIRKNELRNIKTPYYSENDINLTSGVILKEYEIFDGNKVLWGIKENDCGLCKTTPLFDNIVDYRGFDKKRILCNDENGLIIHGKLNDSELLARINPQSRINSKFLFIEDFGGKNVRITIEDDENALVNIENDDLKKYCFYFNYKEFKQYSNNFDLVTVDSVFLKSYIIDGTIRPFVGLVNTDNGVVKPLGFDICKQDYIDFPLDENGLIDDNKMTHNLNEEFYNIGYKQEFYKKLDKRNLITLLAYLDVDGFRVINRLKEQYKIKIKK